MFQTLIRGPSTSMLKPMPTKENISKNVEVISIDLGPTKLKSSYYKFVYYFNLFDLGVKFNSDELNFNSVISC